MGKTKKLAEELKENERPLGPLEHPRPVPKEPAKADAPKIIKMKGLTNELNAVLVEYLETRPYGEVKGLLNSLSQAPILDVTVN